MSITATPFAERYFDIRFRPPTPARTPDSWQRMIGDRRIGARLDTLPDNRISWRAMATSTVTQPSIVVALLLLQIILPQSLITKVEYDVIPLAGPMIDILSCGAALIHRRPYAAFAQSDDLAPALHDRADTYSSKRRISVDWVLRNYGNTGFARYSFGRYRSMKPVVSGEEAV